MYRAMLMRWKLQKLNLLFSFLNNGLSWIFSLKNQPITLYIIYLAFKIFSFNLHAERLKTLLEFGCGNGCFKNFLTRVYFPCPFAFFKSLAKFIIVFSFGHFLFGLIYILVLKELLDLKILIFGIFGI